jgi:hypothetical protein
MQCGDQTSLDKKLSQLKNGSKTATLFLGGWFGSVRYVEHPQKSENSISLNLAA